MIETPRLSRGVFLSQGVLRVGWEEPHQEGASRFVIRRAMRSRMTASMAAPERMKSTASIFAPNVISASVVPAAGGCSVFVIAMSRMATPTPIAPATARDSVLRVPGSPATARRAAYALTPTNPHQMASEQASRG